MLKSSFIEGSRGLSDFAKKTVKTKYCIEKLRFALKDRKKKKGIVS